MKQKKGVLVKFDGKYLKKYSRKVKKNGKK